jgi:hypothetical protein
MTWKIYSVCAGTVSLLKQCNKVSKKIEGHFIGVNKMVEIGSGAKKQINDTPHALCLLSDCSK